jgi:pimeloyl-ACP methyl ester carboxylesterase
MRRWVPTVLLVAVIATGCQSVQQTSADPVQVKMVSVNGVQLAYVEEGAGVPVLFVHGALGDWRTWDGLRPFFSSEYRYLALSRRYHYPNAWADDGRLDTNEQHVEDIAEFIRKLNLGRVHLVGSSYSGRLAGMLALKYPGLLRSAVLGEPGLVPPTSEEGKAARAAAAKDFDKVAVAAADGDYKQAAILLANAVLDDPEGFAKMSPARQQRWLDNAKTLGTPDPTQPARPVTCDDLKMLAVPVLVVRGERTRVNYRYGHEALLSCLPPTAQTAIIPNASHFWAVDNPRDAARAILAFIKQH